MNNPWNKIYKSGKQHSVYPWSNLVSLIKKNFKTNSNQQMFNYSYFPNQSSQLKNFYLIFTHFLDNNFILS